MREKNKKVKFEVFGPFPIARDGHKMVRGALNSLWSEFLESGKENNADLRILHKLVGVYLFTVQSTDTGVALPWYVGQTSKQSFKERLAQQDLHFRRVLDEAGDGNLQLYLLPMKVPGSERYRKPTKKNDIAHVSWLEKFLIGVCYKLNPKLINISSKQKHEVIVVPGIINSLSLASEAEKSFAKVLRT